MTGPRTDPRRAVALLALFTMALAALLGATVPLARPAAAAPPVNPACVVSPAPVPLVDVSGDSCTVGTRADYSHGITFTWSPGATPVCTGAMSGACIAGLEIAADRTSTGLSCDFHPTGSGVTTPAYLEPSGYMNTIHGLTCQTDDERQDTATAQYGGYVTEKLGNGSNYQVTFLVNTPASSPPVASFTATRAGATPDSFAFDGSTSAATTGGTTLTSWAWDFGDGSPLVTSASPTTTHAYGGAGTFTARLTVRDSAGASASTTRRVVAADSDLAAAIAVTAPDGSPLTGDASAKGKTLRARVTLTAATTAGHDLTAVTASPALTVVPAGKLVQQDASAGPPDGGFDLAPGESQSYDVAYTIAGAGSVTLSVEASGEEADERGDASAQQAKASTVAQLSQPLQIDVSFAQDGTDLAGAALGADTIRLADNDKGEIPDALTVTVTVTNVSGAEQDEVALQPTDLSVADPSTNHDPFPADIVPQSDPAIGVMPAGDVVQKLYTMHVTGNQRFHLSQLVLSSDPASDDTEKSLGAGDLTALPTALLLVDDQPDASVPSHIVTGRLVQLDGTVTNLSNTQALDLDPVLARISGNGGGTTSAEKATPTLDGFTAPVTGMLAPGDKETFHVLVQTMPSGGSRSTVTFAPSGRAAQPDGTEQALGASQIRVTTGTSPYLLHLDDSVAAPETAPDPQTAAYIFTASALEGLRDWTANGFHSLVGLADIGTIGDGVVAAGGIVANNVQADYELVSVIKAELALHVFWAVLTPAQKSAFAEQVAIDSDAVGVSFKQFHGAVSSGVMAYFQKFQNDFQRGNTVAAYEDFGHGLGSGVPEALSLLAPGLVLGKVARGLGWGVKAAGAIGETTVARAISLGAKLKESRIAIGTAKALDGVLAGDNLLANSSKVLKKSFGLAQRDIDIFKNLAQRRHLLVAVRQRNPISTAWLKTGKFLPKSELLKIKNVDAIDVEFLGYRGKGGPLKRGDYGTVVFKEPDTISEVVGRLRQKNASPELRKAVMKRFEQREEEWRDYRHLYEEYDKGTEPFDVGFDKLAQGAGGKAKDVRKFHLENVTGSSGRKYYRVQYSDKSGVLKYVTGDIDIVAILNSDGTLPDAATRAAIYDDLLTAVGMQHGDTFAWLKDGELFSKTQAKLLSDHLPGNEQLAVFGPDGGCLAGYFDPKLTVFNTVTHNAYATFVGAYSTPLQKITRYTSLKLGGIK